MAAQSNVLAWRIPGMGEPGGLPSTGLHRVGHDWSDLAAADRGQESQMSTRTETSEASPSVSPFSWPPPLILCYFLATLLTKDTAISASLWVASEYKCWEKGREEKGRYLVESLGEKERWPHKSRKSSLNLELGGRGLKGGSLTDLTSESRNHISWRWFSVPALSYIPSASVFSF